MIFFNFFFFRSDWKIGLQSRNPGAAFKKIGRTFVFHNFWKQYTARYVIFFFAKKMWILLIWQKKKFCLVDPCPKDYTKIGKQCYYFGTREYDWKSSASLCRGAGGDLVEFENIEETEKIKSYLKGQTNIKSRDFWTGGLNPGLLWIWASSAKPVYEDQNHSINGYGR